MKNKKEAFKVMELLLGKNKHLLTEDLKEEIAAQYDDFMSNSYDLKTKRNNYKDILDNRNIKMSILLFTLWYISSYVYYGLIYILPSVYEKLTLTETKTVKLTDKLYDEIIADIIFSCIFEIPSDFANGIVPNIEGIGRKRTIIFGFFGSCLFSFLCFFSWGMIPFYTALVKAFINISFGVLYIYTTEAYPTYMRATALGICNFFSRIGGFTTPFINEYLSRLNFMLPFFAFFATSLLGVIFSILLPFDTLGKTSY